MLVLSAVFVNDLCVLKQGINRISVRFLGLYLTLLNTCSKDTQVHAQTHAHISTVSYKEPHLTPVILFP